MTLPLNNVARSHNIESVSSKRYSGSMYINPTTNTLTPYRALRAINLQLLSTIAIILIITTTIRQFFFFFLARRGK